LIRFFAFLKVLSQSAVQVGPALIRFFAFLKGDRSLIYLPPKETR
jgi:hypothetical protein